MPETMPTLNAQVLDLLPSSSADSLANRSSADISVNKTDYQNSLNDCPSSALGLHHLIENQAALTPDAVAIVHQGQSLTYRVLNERANQLAHYLVALGVKAEQLMGICVGRSPEMLIAFLGVLKAGAAYVPIDPNYPEARRQYILADAKVEITLTQTELAPMMAADGNRLICLDEADSVLAQQSKENLAISLPDEQQAEQLAYVIYTSGSTGNPKGVMAHHRGLVNYSLALAEALELTAADRMLQFSTMSFDFVVSEVYPTLATGGAMVLRSDEMVTSTQAFLDFISATEVSVIQFTTAFWHELVSGLDRLDATLPRSLRLLLFGGEKASLALCQQWVEKIGDYPRLFNAYGPTEATVITTLYDVVAEGYDGTHDLPIGRAIRNAETYVLDEDLKPVAPGEAGELYIGGPGVTRGYLNLPEKTASVFVQSPFEESDRLYKTGDLVRMDDSGLIDFVGRADFQVKIRGFRIELGEIESCLDQYPQVQHRIVVAREDAVTSEPTEKRLVAYIVMKPGKSLDRQDLKDFLQAQLPAFMMPSAIVVMPELPKNANGKIDRNALPAPTYEDSPRIMVPPRTSLEHQLVDLWRSVLGVEAIGITDDFFELGGHSLLVMRLFSELEVLFDQRLPLVEIFKAPSIEQMAERLAQITSDSPSVRPLAPLSDSAQDNALTPLKLGNLNPPLFLVHDFDGDTGLYIHLARRLQGQSAEAEDGIRPIYGIQPKHTDTIPLLQSRIPEMAQHCIEQICRLQPHGPYLVGGLCVGGVIASEVALQLARRGEQVALMLLDSPEPSLENREGSIMDERKERFGEVLASKDWAKVVRQGWQKGVNLIRYEVSDRYQTTLGCARAHAFRWYQDRGWLSSTTFPKALPKVLQGLPVRELIAFAYSTYHPQKQLAGPVLLIRATEGDGSKADQPYVKLSGTPLLGWDSRVQQKLEVCDVPGGHSTMLSDQHVQALADALESFIERSLDTFSPS